MNYVKTRLQLERMPIGAELEVWLDLGEPADQVPRSLRLDGQEVEQLESAGGWSRIRVRRSA